MKTKALLSKVVLGIALLSGWQIRCQSNYIATNTVKFPSLNVGGGQTLMMGFSHTNLFTNFYPYTLVGGDEQEQEFQYYWSNIFSAHEPIPESLAAEQDTNGNWGLAMDGMQLSVRFRKVKFIQGELVPAYIILRNVGVERRGWDRNALPDNGYQFTLQQGTNISTWFRPKQESVPMIFSGGMNEGDPYRYIAYPHTQGLTVVYLNRFFDLNHTGQYSLRVEINVPTMDGKGTTNVVSGMATFEVMQKSSH